MSGRASADAIAHAQLARAAGHALGACGEAAPGAEGRAERFRAVSEACRHLARGGAPGARAFGLPGVALLRALGSNLREESCAAVPPGSDRTPEYVEAVRLHQALDAAATALGAAPDCFDDPDDWRVPDGDGPVTMLHLAPTARTAALVCDGLDALIRPASGAGALMRRDVFRLVAGSLALNAACLDPKGVEPGLAAALAVRTRDCAERICASAAAWRALAPDQPVGRLGDAVESAGRLAGDVLSDLVAAGPPGP